MQATLPGPVLSGEARARGLVLLRIKCRAPRQALNLAAILETKPRPL
jgi:hypothetical protein